MIAGRASTGRTRRADKSPIVYRKSLSLLALRNGWFVRAGAAASFCAGRAREGKAFDGFSTRIP